MKNRQDRSNVKSKNAHDVRIGRLWEDHVRTCKKCREWVKTVRRK